MRIWIREQSSLEYGIRGRLNSWNHVRRRECRLLYLRKIILRVALQSEPAEPAQWHLFVRPDLCQVEDVPAELFRLLRTKDLHIASP